MAPSTSFEKLVEFIADAVPVNPLEDQTATPMPFVGPKYSPDDEQRARRVMGTQNKRPKIYRASEIHLKDRDVETKHQDRDSREMVLYLYIFYEGSARAEEDMKVVVAGNTTKKNEQFVVKEMKDHTVLVQKECVDMMRAGMEKLVAATGGMAVWGQASHD